MNKIFGDNQYVRSEAERNDEALQVYDEIEKYLDEEGMSAAFTDREERTIMLVYEDKEGTPYFMGIEVSSYPDVCVSFHSVAEVTCKDENVDAMLMLLNQLNRNKKIGSYRLEDDGSVICEYNYLIFGSKFNREHFLIYLANCFITPGSNGFEEIREIAEGGF